jgi:hypothetical protein
LKLTKYDYEFLTGRWDGPWGAASNEVAEFCVENGLGLYGCPTLKGKDAIQQYEAENPPTFEQFHVFEDVPLGLMRDSL